jgi:hypothetical protein
VNQQPERWVSILKINEGIHSDPSDIRIADLGEIGRKKGRPRKEFEEIGKTSRLVSSGLGLQPDSSVEDVGAGLLESNSEDGLDTGQLTKAIPFKNPSPTESDDDKIVSRGDYAAGIQIVIDDEDDDDYTDE